MRKRIRHFKTYVRPKEYEYREDKCSYALGASHNLDPTNNNPLVVCFSSPQDHCVTRGFMVECSPTINAAAGMSENNRPFIVHKCYPINSMVIGKDGGDGDRQTFGIGEDGEPCPTIQTSHHHACAIIKKRKNPIVVNFQGSKGNNVVSEDGTSPTLNAMHGHDVHVVCVPRKSLFVVSTKKKGEKCC